MPRRPKSTAAIARGRQHTDRSLDAERAKVDHSSAHQRATAQRDADHAVERSRERIDEQTGRDREQSDRQVMSARADTSVSRASERNDADRRLAAERATVDRASRAERAHADATSDRERSSIEASRAEHYLRERKATDRDLAGERARSDESTLRTATSLAVELGEHLHTRAALGLRDEFLRLLSVDLKKPMLQISTAADRLSHRASHIGADAEDRRMVQGISRSSQEVLRLLGDLLERVAVWQESPSEARPDPERVERSAGKKRPPGSTRKAAAKRK